MEHYTFLSRRFIKDKIYIGNTNMLQVMALV
jgi:hypothetical protein